MIISCTGNQSKSYRVSPAIWDNTVGWWRGVAVTHFIRSTKLLLVSVLSLFPVYDAVDFVLFSLITFFSVF